MYIYHVCTPCAVGPPCQAPFQMQKAASDLLGCATLLHNCWPHNSTFYHLDGVAGSQMWMWAARTWCLGQDTGDTKRQHNGEETK